MGQYLAELGNPLLLSSINSCFVHHLVCIPSSISSINSCLVHHLVWVVLHWSHPSTVVSYIIWYRSYVSSISSCFVPLLVLIPSSVSLLSILVGQHLAALIYLMSPFLLPCWFVFIGLIHQQLFPTSSDKDHLSHPSAVVLYLIWYE